MNKKIKFIDLFAGIGGFHYGITRAIPDAECVYSNEWDKYANSVYRKHFGECDNRDIRTIQASEIPDHDLLMGGFPCQAFSIAGKRNGFSDTRGTLFFEIARILKSHQPMLALLENVKGLVSHDGGRTLEVILDNLQELGYYVNWEIYNSKDFGVPQNRERIFFLCRHYRGLINVGTNKKMTTYESLIQEYLFQLLLNNLAEVKKLQETALKDWVVGYLLSKEMNQSQKSSGENIKDGIMIPTADDIFQSTAEEVWQNIDIWLSKKLGVNSQELNTSTISIVIKKITESKTSTFLQMQELIWLATVVLRKLQPSLWQEVLLNLTLIKEDTKYARINNQKEKIIITETRNAHKSEELQDSARYFIVGHLRGTPRPEVFPIGEANENNTQSSQELREQNSNTLRTNYGVATSNETYIAEIRQMNNPIHSNDRIYSPEGISPTLNTAQGGNRQDMRIRRLTPVEAERLQGFPDNWTKWGSDGQEISDTQRYKMCGNAVTTNVITAIMERLFL